MTRAIDFAALNQGLTAALPSLLPQWLPEGCRQGREWVARNPRRHDRRAGSFSVNLATGRWADFATGDRGGDPVSLYAYLFTDGRQIEAARALACGEAHFAVSRCPAAKPAKPANLDDSGAAARSARAVAIYAAAAPIAGTVAERYLAGRGLVRIAAWESLRSATLAFRGHGAHPALIAPVRQPDGALAGIQRTYLTAEGQKLAGADSKRSLGIVRAGAIRLKLRAEMAHVRSLIRMLEEERQTEV